MTPIRLLHIPKTAGTSLTECLRRIYKGPEFRFSDYFQHEIKRYQKLGASRRAEIVLVSGHAPRITGIDAIDRLPTITLLRDPISRVQSFCQHVSEGKSHFLAPRFPPETFNLHVFLDSGLSELSNFQTKTLLGKAACALPDYPETELVSMATDVLRNDLAGFGLVEQFDYSLMLFKQRFAWRQMPLYRKVNRKNKRRALQFNSDHISRIRALNGIDLQVYEKAVGLFNKRIEKARHLIEPNIATFRRYRMAFSPYLLARTCMMQIRRMLAFRKG